MALVLLVAPAGADVEPPRGDEIGAALERAAALLAGGQAYEAEGLYRDLRSRHPGLTEAYEGLADALAAQNRRREAAAVLEELGRGWLAGGDYRTATGYLERSAEWAPDWAPAHATLGRALLLGLAYGRAEEHLARAVNLGDSSVATRTYLAAALAENGKAARAEALLQGLAASGALAPLHQLGRLLLGQGRYDEALAALARAIALGPPPVDLELDLGQALEGVGRIDDAIAAYERAAASAPDPSRAHYRLAVLLARRGEGERAAAELETYRRLYAAEQERVRRQGVERARLDRGWHLLRTGRPEQAAEQFRAVPETADSLRGLALALSALGRHRDAAQALERAVAAAPEDQELRLLLADERRAAGLP
jgi:tetratricopeptide (TPR) repeat protein